MAVKKSGLGKGLDSLIPRQSLEKKVTQQPAQEKVETVVKTVVKKEEVMLRISEVEPNRDQPRKKFDEDSLLELADSIRQFGILQPLLVQKRDGYYEIIAGERRWRAAKIAGLREVPVIIKDFTDQQIVEISLIENIQREDLNPIEEAQAYKRLLTEFHLKQDEVAERVSKSRTSVTNSMRLLKLDPRVQQMVVEDMITTGHARALLAISDGDLQYKIAMQVFDGKLSVRDVERLMKSMQNKAEKENQEKQESGTEKKDDFIYQNLEESMKALLGTKVSITRKSDHQGKIVIDYYSNEELERLMELFRSVHPYTAQ
ncbi:MAG TPA: chromosome partitioning protein ParB [Lachnospiraceae bacterium]|nr:chromosome partitioning protein ParB [Lachnospiraceae bacterium]